MAEKRKIERLPEHSVPGEFGPSERYGGPDTVPVHRPDTDSDVEPTQ